MYSKSPVDGDPAGENYTLMPWTEEASGARASILPSVNIMEAAPTFSSRRLRLRVPGIGTVLTFRRRPWACSQASAIRAMVRIRPLPGKLHLVERLIQERQEFVECDKITGDDPFVARLVVHTIEQMDDVLEALSEHAVTSTAVIKGTSVKRRLPPL